ncbi:MAG: hypothetical protein E7328_04010 [Clostridiales bacterium]|nr:hypothetical protein [Clostridiales bacterium]
MKFPKLVALVLSIVMVLAVMAGCGAPAEESKDATITLTDHAGREVTLEGAAQAICGTHNPSLNMAIVLDGGMDRFVGFGNKDMAYGLYEIVAPEIDELTQIGKGKNVNFETVASVKADLALLPVRMKGMVEQYEEVGPKVILLDVELFDSIKSALTLVGKAIGQDERAAKIVAFFDQKIADATKVAEDAETKPTVLMLSGSSMTGVATDAMLQNQIIKTAGGKSVTEGWDSDELWAEVNIEQIVKWNPEIIYIPAYADYTVEDLKANEAWASIDAVKNDKIFVFPSALEPWDYPTASACLGLCWTTYNLHPELYSLDQLMKDVDEFYNLVYGQTFTAEQLGLK